MTIERPAPIRSSDPPPDRVESGTKKNPSTIATAAMGTLTRNTEPHAEVLEQQAAAERTDHDPEAGDTPAQMPIARARSCPVRTCWSGSTASSGR